MKRVLSSALIFFIVSGCTQLTSYRTNFPIADQTVCEYRSIHENTDERYTEECHDQAYYLIPDIDKSGTKHSDIPIGIIEFDDQGVLQDRAAKVEIMRRIRQLNENGKTLTVVFAHGWRNNAEAKNDNLLEFQEMLKKIAGATRKAQKPRKVMGVYLAWRGRSVPEAFYLLSFWNRKDRAEYIGQHGATEVLTDLTKIHAGDGDRKRLIFIGHSLGGSLLYGATQQLLMKDASNVDMRKETEKLKVVKRNAADLIILVNPAFEAARFTALHEKALRMNYRNTQSPILAMFTSKTDWPTKLGFPFGRIVSTALTDYNTHTHPKQAELDRTAVGHYADYQTHELHLKDGDDHNVCCDVQDPEYDRKAARTRWNDFRNNPARKCWHTAGVVLKRKPISNGKDPIGSGHLNPFYNVTVDDAIISGHSGIWKPKYFMSFLYEFINVQD